MDHSNGSDSQGKSPVTSDTYFAIVPEWILDAEISDKAVRLYGVLARYSDKATHECIVNRDTIAERMRCSAATVWRTATELVDIGALTVEQRKVRGQQAASRFHIHPSGRSTASRQRDDSASAVARPRVPAVARPRAAKKEPESLEPEIEPSLRSGSPRSGRAVAMPSVNQRANTLVGEWWDERITAGDPSAQSFNAVRGVVAQALKNGVSDGDVWWALRHVPTVSGGAIEMALSRRKGNGARAPDPHLVAARSYLGKP